MNKSRHRSTEAQKRTIGRAHDADGELERLQVAQLEQHERDEQHERERVRVARRDAHRFTVQEALINRFRTLNALQEHNMSTFREVR